MLRWATFLGVGFALVATWLLFVGQLPWQQGVGDSSQLPASGSAFQEIARFRAPEAHQGVAVSAAHFFVIGNQEIAKYDRETVRRVGEWRDVRGGPIIEPREPGASQLKGWESL